MADEHLEKIVKLLEEIRDLTIKHSADLEAWRQSSAQTLKEARERALVLRRRLLWITTGLFVLVICGFIYMFVWAIPASEEHQTQRQEEEYQAMVRSSLSNYSNYISQPH